MIKAWNSIFRRDEIKTLKWVFKTQNQNSFGQKRFSLIGRSLDESWKCALELFRRNASSSTRRFHELCIFFAHRDFNSISLWLMCLCVWVWCGFSNKVRSILVDNCGCAFWCLTYSHWLFSFRNSLSILIFRYYRRHQPLGRFSVRQKE